MATAAASWISPRSISLSSPLGVSALTSGATTEIELSLPVRFSLPPTREGRCGRMALPVVVSRVGVSEPFRSAAVVVRDRFWPAVDLGKVADFGAVSTFFWFFLLGASGCGHSTS